MYLLSPLFVMASVQKGVNAHRSIHHDCQQLGDVKTILMDCAEKLKNANNSRVVIVKSTELAFEVESWFESTSAVALLRSCDES